jgi:iron(III) transport system substrate-binding protein
MKILRHLRALAVAVSAAASLGMTAGALAQSSNTAAAMNDPAFKQKWAELVAAAKKEGGLAVVSTTGATRSMPPLVKAFQREFGIDVTMTPGGPLDLINRVTAERSAGRYTVDVGMMGPTEIRTLLIPRGFLQPIVPMIIRPDVLDLSLWYGGHYWWWDAEKKYDFEYAAAAGLGVGVYYNTDRVKPKDVAEIQSLWDLLNPKWKGQFASIPPGVTGAGSNWYGVYAHPDLGLKWCTEYIKDMNVRWTKATSIAADWVAKGVVSWGIMIGGGESVLDTLRAQGAPIAKLSKPLKDREVLSGGGGINQIFAFDHPQHPNATKLFINWFLSREGQTAYVTSLKAPNPPDSSLRNEVPPGNTLPDERRVPGKEYYFIISSNSGVPSRAQMSKDLVPIYKAVAGQ